MSVPPGSSVRNSLRRVLPAIAVVLVGVASYSTSLDVPLQFDDVDVIVREPAVHATDLSLEAMARAAHGFPLNRWLARASFAVNYAVHGLRPPGYHVVNLAFHLGTALLVLALARRFLAAAGYVADDRARRQAATVAALLFVAHPVHTQAVTYVVQRMTSMGAFFALAALLLWLAGGDRAGAPRVALRVGAVGSWVLAMSCKENYAILPLLVALVALASEPDVSARIRRRWKSWTAAILAYAAAGGAAVWSYWPTIERDHARFGIPIADRLLSQGRILIHYLSLVVLPLPGRLQVDPAVVPSTGLLEPATTLPALLAVSALAAGAVWARHSAPLVSLAIGWFFVALVVEQTILPLDLAFEQRIYFADVGLLVLAGAALVRLAPRSRFGPWPLAAPVVALLAAGTVVRNGDWQDGARLFASAATGEGQARGLLNVAASLAQEGKLDEAEATLRRAAGLDPRDPSPLVNLGGIALLRGDPVAAEAWCRRGLAIAPAADGWQNLGKALAQQGRVAEAMEAYRAALAMAPSDTDARVDLAVLQYRAGDAAGALAGLGEALRLDPGSVSALVNRAELLEVLGRRAEALDDARRALAIAPGDRWARAVVERLGGWR